MPIKQLLKKNKTIVKNASYLSIIEGVRLIMPFIALPYILNTVGSEKYGTVVFVQSIIAYFSIIIAFGLDISAIKNVSINRKDIPELSKIVSAVLLIKSFLLLVSFAILLLLIFVIPLFQAYSVLFLFAFIACLSEILFPAWFYQGIEKMGNITLIRFSSILLYVIAIFVFVHEESDYIYIPLLYSLAYVIPALIGFIILLKKGIRLVFPGKNYMIQIFRESIPFFISRVSVVIHQNIAKTLTGLFLGMNEVTVYDIAQKIINGAAIPLQMLNQAVFPHNANKRDKVFARKLLWVMIGSATLLSGLVFLFSPLLIRILGVQDVETCYNICMIFTLWLMAAAVSIYLGSPVLVAFGFPKPFNLSVIYSTALLILLYGTIYSIGMFSVYSFAFILVLTELFIASYRFYFCKKYRIL